MVPVASSVSADETEALKAEITKAVEKVQEAGETGQHSIDQLLLFITWITRNVISVFFLFINSTI